jgi:hypothetical protein
MMRRPHARASRDLPPLPRALLVYHGMNGNEDNYYGGTDRVPDAA